MIFESIIVGTLGTNCFIVADEESKEALVVDPGAEAVRIYNKLEKLELKLKYIVVTHGHWDHISGVSELKRLTGAKILAHPEEEEMLNDPKLNLSIHSGALISFIPDETIGDRMAFNVGKHKCEIIHIPGHSKGGICLFFRDEKTLIAGDTLFYGSIARTDLYGGNHKLLIDSIKNKLLALDDDVKVYPGHGSSTTIGFERKKNPFL